MQKEDLKHSELRKEILIGTIRRLFLKKKTKDNRKEKLISLPGERQIR